MQAQNVFNGVSEDKEILRKEREQWEMEKKAKELKREAERLREMELMRKRVTTWCHAASGRCPTH